MWSESLSSRWTGKVKQRLTEIKLKARSFKLGSTAGTSYVSIIRLDSTYKSILKLSQTKKRLTRRVVDSLVSCERTLDRAGYLK